MYWKIPLKNYPQGYGWVDTRKFDPYYYSREKMDKLVRLCPEYFSGYDGFEEIGDDEDEELTEEASQETSGRGFSFNR